MRSVCWDIIPRRYDVIHRENDVYSFLLDILGYIGCFIELDI